MNIPKPTDSKELIITLIATVGSFESVEKGRIVASVERGGIVASVERGGTMKVGLTVY